MAGGADGCLRVEEEVCLVVGDFNLCFATSSEVLLVRGMSLNAETAIHVDLLLCCTETSPDPGTFTCGAPLQGSAKR